MPDEHLPLPKPRARVPKLSASIWGRTSLRVVLVVACGLAALYGALGLLEPRPPARQAMYWLRSSEDGGTGYAAQSIWRGADEEWTRLEWVVEPYEHHVVLVEGRAESRFELWMRRRDRVGAAAGLLYELGIWDLQNRQATFTVVEADEHAEFKGKRWTGYVPLE